MADGESSINTIILAIIGFGIGGLLATRMYGLLLVVGLCACVFYMMFTRQIKNAFYTIVPRWQRSYVVAHFRKHATKIPLTYYLLPDEKTNSAVIEKGWYDCSPDGALPDIPLFKKRLHFLFDEGDSTPRKVELEEIKDDRAKMFTYKGKIFFDKTIGAVEKYNQYKCPKCNETITVDKGIIRNWAFRVKSALTTQAYDFIYGEKRQWAFIIAMVAATIAIIVCIYTVMQIQEIKPLVATIYERTIIGNETMVIKPK